MPLPLSFLEVEACYFCAELLLTTIFKTHMGIVVFYDLEVQFFWSANRLREVDWTKNLGFNLRPCIIVRVEFCESSNEEFQAFNTCFRFSSSYLFFSFL